MNSEKFLFSHSRPPSLIYDPNRLLCVLGSVPDLVCVSGSARVGFEVYFYVVFLVCFAFSCQWSELGGVPCHRYRVATPKQVKAQLR